MTVVLTQEEYNQGYEKCFLLIKEHTGWELKMYEYNSPKKPKLSDTLMSDKTLKVEDVCLQHYYKEACSFGFDHKSALDYAKANVFPSDPQCFSLKLSD